MTQVSFDIEIVLRETDRAIAERASHPSAPSAWTDDDVREVLKKILMAIDRVKNPDVPPREATLRGFSWIVEPLADAAGVVIAVEIPTGAAVAGPFDIAQDRLTTMIGRVLRQAAASATVH